LLRLIVSCVIALGLLAAAANIMDPYLTPVRSWAPAAIVAVSCLGIVLTLRTAWRGKAAQWVVVMLWCSVPLTLAGAKAVFLVRKNAVLSASGPQVEALGRHFMVGYTNTEEVETLAAKGLIGGLFITRRNVQGKTMDAVRSEIARLQDVRKINGLPPLIVATDQEGGLVSRLSPPLASLPSLASLVELPAERRVAAAHAYGTAQGRELASAGINVNFAPVLDLRPRVGPSLLDRNSHIEQRAISSNPDIVAEIGLAYARGLLDAGVTPTVKHFPGLGRITEDTHHFRSAISTAKAELEATDWQPFRQVLSNTNAILMIGHVTLTAVDPDRPASHSHRVIEGLLRREWGYQGVVVTDDLVMSPIYQYGFCNAIIESINAGVDILLIAYDGQQYYRAMRCALKARDRGLLDEARLAASDRRLNERGTRSNVVGAAPPAALR
jgi:beta-N-acetylhexosaminidase